MVSISSCFFFHLDFFPSESTILFICLFLHWVTYFLGV
jgi:hypothetical protein